MHNFKRILKYFAILHSINTCKIQSMAIAMQIYSRAWLNILQPDNFRLNITFDSTTILCPDKVAVQK